MIANAVSPIRRDMKNLNQLEIFGNTRYAKGRNNLIQE